VSLLSGARWGVLQADRYPDEQLHKQQDKQDLRPHPVQLPVPQPPHRADIQLWRGGWVQWRVRGGTHALVVLTRVIVKLRRPLRGCGMGD